jgi:membrane dipeptidase
MALLLRGIATLHKDALAVVTSPRELSAAANASQIGLVLHVEGAEQISRISQVADLYELGVRSVGIVANSTNVWGDAALDSPRWNGLSSEGVELVGELNRRGMIVDLSHATDSTAIDALRTSRAPVIMSHSSTRSIAKVPRNISDDLLRNVGKNGGVVMVTFVPYFTTTAYANWYRRGEEVWDSLSHAGDKSKARDAMAAWEASHPPPAVGVADVADHVEHVARIAGIDHVGLGSDFDGMYSYVPGLEDVSKFPALIDELRRRGWSRRSLAKVAGANVLRVWQDVERVGLALRSGR